MEPLLKNGRFFWINTWTYWFRKPRAGETVVFQNPRNSSQLLCKKIASINGDNYVLLGINHNDSLDSRILGPIQKKYILGKVLIRER